MILLEAVSGINRRGPRDVAETRKEGTGSCCRDSLGRDSIPGNIERFRYFETDALRSLLGGTGCGHPMGDMHIYVQHIKAEVTARLNTSETLSLLKSAADVAKARAQEAIRSLRMGDPQTETARLTSWCQTVVKPLVRQVMDTHDLHHDQIDQLIEKGKKD